MYTLPRKHLRSSDIPAGLIQNVEEKRKNLLLYLGVFFLIAISFPIASELYDDLVYQPHPGILKTKSVLHQGSLGHETFIPSVVYSYKINGQEFQSEKLFGGSTPLYFSSRSEAESVLADLSENSECTVYADPTHPANSFLKKIYQQSPSFILNGLLGFTISGAFILIALTNPFEFR